MKRRARVALLAGTGSSSRIVARALDERFDLVLAIVERRPSRWRLVRRRAARLGWPRVADQLVFQAAITPLLVMASRRRAREILESHGWSDAELPNDRVVRVDSVNDSRVEGLLAGARPDVVVVNGTRIVARKILAAVDAPFLNMHAGITPRYRGVHGGYWALAEQRADLCGVTVHLVDAGIDTGGVLAQARVRPDADDSFATYPLLQLAAGLPLLLDAVDRVAAGDLRAVPPMTTESELRYHPEASSYLWRRWKYGVR